MTDHSAHLEIPEHEHQAASALCILRMLPGLTTRELVDEIGVRSSTFHSDPVARHAQVLMSLYNLCGQHPPQLRFVQDKGKAGRWFPHKH